ncbi:unnamed protein product [Paramecium pentaurelia]|uniref:Uncharacterized protein n=1 Tax=Paramecium pentaurelia TaxID=43138 RepID=A0A8S1X0K4_9CILI|nr:unnamed protein product [Paramecium pentaurelia]
MMQLNLIFEQRRNQHQVKSKRKKYFLYHEDEYFKDKKSIYWAYVTIKQENDLQLVVDICNQYLLQGIELNLTNFVNYDYMH